MKKFMNLYVEKLRQLVRGFIMDSGQCSTRIEKAMDSGKK